MGLKDMFRTSKRANASPNPSPKTSRAGSPPKQSRGISADSRSSRENTEPPQNQSGSMEDASKHVAALEKELSQSRLDAIMMREKLADLERKSESGGVDSKSRRLDLDEPHEEDKRRATIRALEERIVELRSEVHALEDMQRSSANSPNNAASSKDGGNGPKIHESNLVYLSQDEHEKYEKMAARIQELEQKLGERSGGSITPDDDIHGLAARLKSAEKQLEKRQEDLEMTLKERDLLKEALQDADDRLEQVEMHGAESNMHNISRMKDLEHTLVVTQRQLQRAEMAAKIAEHAFEELKRRKELEDQARQQKENQNRSRNGGGQVGSRQEDTGATSADSISDDDSEWRTRLKTRKQLRSNQIEPVKTPSKHSSQNQSNTASPKQDSGRAPRDDLSNSNMSSPAERGHDPPKDLAGPTIRPNDVKGESPSARSERGEDIGSSESHLTELEAERAKCRLLEIKLAEYQQRVDALENSFLASSNRQLSGGLSILDRTNQWVKQRKHESEQRTREEVEDEIFKKKVELAKSRLKGAKSSPRVPDLGFSHPWERASPRAKKKGIVKERPTSPTQKKHFDAIMRSSVTHSDAGIAGPQPRKNEDEKNRGTRTDRSWNPTQLKGSKYGFTPAVEEKAAPRVTIIAPDKVTGSDKAPWLVECHPDYSEHELLHIEGVGRSKRHFEGKGFTEDLLWPEHKVEEQITYTQRRHALANKGHYAGGPVRASDAAGCPSDIPVGANIQIYREQYGDAPGKVQWYDNGAKGIKTDYVDHVAVRMNQEPRRRHGKALFEAKTQQLFGASPFGTDAQAPVASSQENWNVDRSPAPFGRDDQVPAGRAAWN